MPFQDVKPPDAFVGRDDSFEWLERLFFRREYSRMPLVVKGAAGIGKTAFVAQFLYRHTRTEKPAWFDLATEDDFDVAREKLKDGLRSRFRRGEETCVLDGAERYSEEQIDTLCSTIRNHKIYRNIFIVTRKDLTFHDAPVLTLAALTPDESRELLSRLSVEVYLDPELTTQILSFAQGHPLTLQLIAGLLRNGGVAALSSLLNGQIYNLSDNVSRGEIITIAKPTIILANHAVIERLKSEPESVFKLTPRKFEELLAELLKDMGMEVELTKQTRDGGRDILAYVNTPVGKLLCLVEAKRYREDRKIGIGLVKNLWGTLCDEHANSAMMVTTSSYSPDARAFQSKYKYKLQLREYGDIVTWIQGYGTGPRLP